MGILFKARVAVRGQHLAVRIDVDALALRLLEQALQVVQVVAGNHDERSLFHRQRHGGRLWRAVGLRVGLVEQRHAAVVFLADLQHKGEQVIHAPVLADGKQCLGKKAVDLAVRIAQHHRVVGVRRHAADTEQDKRLETADVLVRRPEPRDIVVIVVPAGRHAGRAVRHKTALLRPHACSHIPDGRRVKVHIRERSEKRLDDEAPCALVHAGAAVRSAGKADERAGQLVLQICRLGALSAHTRAAGAARAVRRLLALKTKHLVVHRKNPPHSVVLSIIG